MGKQWKQCQTIFWDSKITAVGDCSHEIKRHLLLGRKAITNLNSMLKSRDITLLTKVSLVKALIFPVVMYGCESWTIKKAEHWRNDTWTVVLEKTPESPLDCKEIQPVHSKGNWCWIFIHWKDWCWSWSSNTLATWCENLTQWKRPWCWERLKAGGEEDNRGWDGRMAPPTQRTSLSKLWEMVMDREVCCATVHGVTKSRTWLSNWTEVRIIIQEKHLKSLWEVSCPLEVKTQLYQVFDPRGYIHQKTCYWVYIDQI